MSENILEKIIKKKIEKIDILKKSVSIDSLKDKINELTNLEKKLGIGGIEVKNIHKHKIESRAISKSNAHGVSLNEWFEDIFNLE